MDKKNTILGALLLALAFGLMFWGREQQRRADEWRRLHPPAETAPATSTGTDSPLETPAAPPSFQTATTPAGDPGAPAPAATTAGLSAPAATTPPATYKLENDAIAVTFTERGGAIQTVELKAFDAKLGAPENVLFNEDSPLPALSLALPSAGVAGGLPPAPLLATFSLVGTLRTDTSLVFQYQSPEGVEITRSYAILPSDAPGDHYIIAHETRLANRGAAPVLLDRLFLNAGMAPPTPGSGSTAGIYLNFGYYDGSSAHFIKAIEFVGSPGFFGLIGGTTKKPFVAGQTEGAANLQWVSVKNEFFAAVLTPRELLGAGYFAAGVPLTMNGKPEMGVTGDLIVNLGILAPGQDKSAKFSYYVGPKEYVRLDQLGQNQDLVMEFGWFGWLSQLLLLGLIALHKALVHVSPEWAWGWSIVVITILIKLLMWPLTAVQVKSSKRMAQIQAPLAELREKYKDQPEKLQREMLELFKKNNINPAAGCLPLLIQFPIFLAFYAMLRTSSELRYAGFLWIHDLSAPDTVGHLLGFPFNPLPLLMTITMVVQMRLTPSPTADNAQKIMFQLMPFIFLFFFYTMPSGMILYWTCQNLFTIAQQLITNRMKDDPKPAAGTASGKQPGKTTPAKPAPKSGKA